MTLDDFNFFTPRRGEAVIGVASINGYWQVVYAQNGRQFTKLETRGSHEVRGGVVIDVRSTGERIDELRYTPLSTVSFRGVEFEFDHSAPKKGARIK